MTRGDISTGVDPSHLQLVLHKLHDVGATVTQSDDGFEVVQYERPKACNVATLPFPGFPTDLQPMAIAMAAIADGTSMITENVFEPGPLRRGDDPARRRRPDRRPSRGGARRAAVVEVRQCGVRTSGPAPAQCSPGWWPTERPRSTTFPHRPGVPDVRRGPGEFGRGNRTGTVGVTHGDAGSPCGTGNPPI